MQTNSGETKVKTRFRVLFKKTDSLYGVVLIVIQLNIVYLSYFLLFFAFMLFRVFFCCCFLFCFLVFFFFDVNLESRVHSRFYTMPLNVVMKRSRTLIITLWVDIFVDPIILRLQVTEIVDSLECAQITSSNGLRVTQKH